MSDRNTRDSYSLFGSRPSARVPPSPYSVGARFYSGESGSTITLTSSSGNKTTSTSSGNKEQPQTNSARGASEGAKLPAIRRPQPQTARAPHQQSQQQQQQQEWAVKSPRAERMQVLLGKQEQQQSQQGKTVLQPAGPRQFQQLQALQHPPSGQQQANFSQTYSAPHSQSSQQQQMSSTNPHDVPFLAPHPPSDAKRPPQSYHNNPYYSSTQQESKEDYQSSFSQSQQQPQQRMFMPAGGVKRYYRKQQQHRGRGGGGHVRRTTAPPTALRPVDSLGNSPTDPVFTPKGSVIVGGAKGIPQLSSLMLPAQKQLVVDFLTDPSRQLFRVTNITEEASNQQQQVNVALDDDHLDALLSLSGMQDGASLIRSLRSLERMGQTYDSTDSLVEALNQLISARDLTLQWMRGSQCRIFGNSPFVMFLNAQAVDRLVEESGINRLAALEATQNQDNEAPTAPPAAQAYTDMLHLLQRLNESGLQAHYFSELISHCRGVVDAALERAGVDPGPSLAELQQQQPNSGSKRSNAASRASNVSNKVAPSRHLKYFKDKTAANAARQPRGHHGHSESMQEGAPPSARHMATSSISSAYSFDEKDASASPRVMKSPRGGGFGFGRTPLSPRAALTPQQQLKQALVEYFTSDMCELFVPGFDAVMELPGAEQDLDELVKLLGTLFQIDQQHSSSSAPITKPSHHHQQSISSVLTSSTEPPIISSIELLHGLETPASSVTPSIPMRFESIPELLHAFRSGRADLGPLQRRKRKVKVQRKPFVPAVKSPAAPPAAATTGAEPSASEDAKKEDTAAAPLLSLEESSTNPVQAPADAPENTASDDLLSESFSADSFSLLAASSSVATLVPTGSSLTPGAFEEKKRRLAILAFLSNSALLDPKPTASDLYAQILAEPVEVDTLSQLKELETEQITAESYAKLLQVAKQRSNIDTNTGIAHAVHQYLSTSLLLGSNLATEDESIRLLSDSGSGPDCVRHLKNLEADRQTFESLEDLTEAVRMKHIELLLSRSKIPRAIGPAEGQHQSRSGQRSGQRSPRKSKSSRSSTHTFAKNSARNSVAASPVLSANESHASTPPVESVELNPIQPPRSLGVERTAQFEIAPEATEEQTYDTTSSNIVLIDASNPGDELQVEVVSETDPKLEDEAAAVNRLRRTIWEYVHDSSCFLFPRSYEPGVEEIEVLVDDLAEGYDEQAENQLLQMLQGESARIFTEKLQPFANVQALIEYAMSKRYAEGDPEQEAALASSRAHKVSAFDSEELASMLHFLSSPDTNLTPVNVQLYEEDMEILYQAGGADSLLFLWEMSEAHQERDPAYNSVSQLRSVLSQKRQAATQESNQWSQRMHSFLQDHADVIFKDAQAGSQILSELTEASYESLCPLNDPIEKRFLLQFVKQLYQQRFSFPHTTSPLNSFQEFKAYTLQAFKSLENAKQNLFRILSANSQRSVSHQIFPRKEVKLSQELMERCILWSDCSSGEAVEYLESIEDRIAAHGAFPFFNTLILFMRRMHQAKLDREPQPKKQQSPQAAEASYARALQRLAHSTSPSTVSLQSLVDSNSAAGAPQPSPSSPADQEHQTNLKMISTRKTERDQWLRDQEVAAAANTVSPQSMDLDVPLMRALEVFPDSLQFTSENPKHTLTVKLNDDRSPKQKAQEDFGDAENTHPALVVQLFSSNPMYKIVSVNPLFLLPGEQVQFEIENHCATPNARGPATLTLRARTVQPGELDNFSAEELWENAKFRITQEGVIAAATGDGSAAPSPNPKKSLAAELEQSKSAAPPVSASIPVAIEAAAPVPVAASDAGTIHISEVPADDIDKMQAATSKRRAKRMTQAVDMNAVRAMGILKKAEPAAAANPTATASVSNVSSVPASVSAASATEQPPVMTHSSNAGPVAIAAADEQYARMDATTKRRNKRATQVTGSLADYVKQAAENKKTVPQAQPVESAAAPVPIEVLNDVDGAVIGRIGVSESGPVAIARLDEEVARMSDVAKRKAKRATQSVDPVMAAALYNRQLAKAPAQAQEKISTTPMTGVSPRQSLTASSATSAVAIAAADEETNNLSAEEKRRARRVTSITNNLPAHIKINDDAPPRRRSVPSNEEEAKEQPPASTSTAMESPIHIANPTGAIAVAVADTQVAAMSPRERKRGKRMTQALHDMAYDMNMAKLLRPKEIAAAEAEEKHASATSASPEAVAAAVKKEKDPMQAMADELRAAPRLAEAASAIQDPSFAFSSAYVATARDPASRMKYERQQWKNIEDPLPQASAAGPIDYFVDGATTGCVTVTPARLFLRPAIPLQIQVRNTADFAVCLFAITSEEEYQLTAEVPCPTFLQPDEVWSLSVCYTGEVAPTSSAPSAELALVLKPCLANEDKLHQNADIFWQSYPHRVMQKQMVKLFVADSLVPHPPVASPTGVAGRRALGNNSPGATGQDLETVRRRKAARRVSGTDFMYPAAGEELAAAAKNTAASETPVSSPVALPTSSPSVPTISLPADPAQALVSQRMGLGTNSTESGYDTYRQNAQERLMAHRVEQYPDYVRLVTKKENDNTAAPALVSGPESESGHLDQSGSVADLFAASASSSAAEGAQIKHVSTIALPVSPDSNDSLPTTSSTAPDVTSTVTVAEERAANRLNIVSPQQRQMSYKSQMRMDGESRIIDQRHSEYPQYVQDVKSEEL